MKRIFFLGIFVLMIGVSVYGTVLKGRVVLLNSGGKSLENVRINSDGGVSTVSTGSGLFELDFKKKKPGEEVSIRAQKNGYEVINSKDLERVTLRLNPDHVLILVMCPEETLKKDSRLYYGITESAYKEALTIYQKLAETNPSVYLSDVAMTLNNLGALYYKMNRLTESKTASAEALERYRKLAETNPSEYLPDVADTLYNLGALYYEMNHLTEAKTAYAEALSIRRKLTKTNLSSYLPDVGMTLYNLGNLYYKMNRLTDAETAYAEALSIRRKLTKTNPSAYLSYVATTLNNQGALYYKMNRLTEAEKTYEEALATYRKLSETNPSAYLSYVAASLYNIALLDMKNQKYSDAFNRLREALTIREKLATQNPSAFELSLCETILPMISLSITAPNVCGSIKNEIPPLLDRAITILKKYRDNPQAQNYLKFAEELKTEIK